MEPDIDQPKTGRRFTVSEAADVLGISVEAVRGRIKRETIAHERDGERVYVILDVDQASTGRDQGEDRRTDQSELVEVLRATVEDLRGRLDRETEANRENRRIIAGLIERVPELEAPAAPDRGPQQAEAGDEGPVRGPVPQERQTATERPWWRKMFGR